MPQKPRPLDPAHSPLAGFGAELRSRRLQAGLSQAALGRLVHVSGDLIGKIEKAERHASSDLVARLDAATGAHGDLDVIANQAARPSHGRSTDDRDELSPGAHRPSSGLPTGSGASGVDNSDDLTAMWFRADWETAFTTASEQWDLDKHRRRLPTGASCVGAGSSAPALQWLLGQTETIARTEGRVAVGLDHVEGIRQTTRALRAHDNRRGGGDVLPLTMRFLVEDVTPLVHNGRYDSGVGRQLLGAAAEVVQLAGWACHDTGQQEAARRYLIQALRMARSCGDEALGAEILAGLSQQAIYLGQHATALDLARASGMTARRRGVDALVAEACVMRAHAHACAGAGTECARALHEAELVLDNADRSADPQWISYFDQAYLSAKFGHCFTALRQPRTARAFAERSLRMNGAYVRGRAFNLALLATAHAQLGEVEPACTLGAQAARLARHLYSTRTVEYINVLRRELSPYRATPDVRAFELEASPVLRDSRHGRQ